MRLNPDCVRDVLLAVEEKEYAAIYTLESLKQHLPQYSMEDLHYTCLQLEDGGFLNLETSQRARMRYLWIDSIEDLTFMGHEFLDTIRQPSIWEDAKARTKKIGIMTIKSLWNIAASIAEDSIKSLFEH